MATPYAVEIILGENFGEAQLDGSLGHRNCHCPCVRTMGPQRGGTMKAGLILRMLLSIVMTYVLGRENLRVLYAILICWQALQIAWHTLKQAR